MKKTLHVFIFLFFIVLQGFAQVVGHVTNAKNEPLPAVNVYLEDTYKSTVTNKNGKYVLELNKTGTKTIVFQYLGFETLKKKIDITAFPYKLNVQLKESPTTLKAVTISFGENPANRIIRNAIAHRKKNWNKIKTYTANFYSKGVMTLENAPDKILGQKVSYGGVLDSTNSGILYLSETRSKIKYKAPNHFYEHILASKVSGEDNGISLNRASQANFSFYHNTIALNADLISPLADYAFNYYTYKLLSNFKDDAGHLIYKIKVIPKRPEGRVFSGFIFIVEDSWAIYGVNLTTTGAAAHIPFIDQFHLNQSFKYAARQASWIKISQNIEVSFDMFGISGTGQFIAVYNNYDFSPQFSPDSFGNLVMRYAKNANEKDSVFWEEKRPIPLTKNETENYSFRDSIARVRHSKTYKDSVDREFNQFSVSDIFFGYHYRNSYKHYNFDISSPLFGVRFNTVQGWNLNLKTSFRKNNKETKTYWRLFNQMSYGFADDRFRLSGGFQKEFNNFSKPTLRIEGGIKAMEINNTQPTSTFVHSIATIFFEENYRKLYDKLYAKASYKQEFFNGFHFFSVLAFERRTPLLNTTDHVFIDTKHGGYTANNPLQPHNFGSVPFQEHNIAKLLVGARINFGQKYALYPNGKYNKLNHDYPSLYVRYEKGFASSVKAYNYGQIQLRLTQDVDLNNLGELGYNVVTGKFFNGDNIALVDFKHFRGNQTNVTSGGAYLNRFNLLPYYKLSTNDQYAAAHLEYNLNGLILEKIPGLNALNFNLILGGHALWTTGHKPYQEFSIGLDNLGFGPIRFLRIDYVQSFYNGQSKGGIIFGVKVLNMF